MNILLLIKAVPNVDDLKLNAGEEFKLEKFKHERKINTFDKYIVEAATRVKEELEDTKIVSLLMGKGEDSNALIYALSLSADYAYMACDDKFLYSDSVATAKILSASIKHLEKTHGKFDLILCGKESIDGSSFSIGKMVSDILDIDYESSIVEMNIEDNFVKMKKRSDEGFTDITKKLPLCLTFTKPNFETRFPTFKRIRWANQQEIKEISYDDLKGYINENEIGKNSFTKVLSVKKPGRNSKNRIIDLMDEETISKVEMLIKMLDEDKILKG